MAKIKTINFINVTMRVNIKSIGIPKWIEDVGF
jgi:hypothetical protein